MPTYIQLQYYMTLTIDSTCSGAQCVNTRHRQFGGRPSWELCQC